MRQAPPVELAVTMMTMMIRTMSMADWLEKQGLLKYILEQRVQMRYWVETLTYTFKMHIRT
jgi:hypothetical protein